MYKLAQLLPALYCRDTKWKLKEPYSIKGNRYVLQTPIKLSVNIEREIYYIDGRKEINLSVKENWDTSNNGIDYTLPKNRAGQSFYIYACFPYSVGDTPDIVLSANSTVPCGYQQYNSRKIGGFHCLCESIGDIKGHLLSGFLAGDILPASIWDLLHRPDCDIPGLVYDEKSSKWYFIYLPSGIGVSTDSIYGGTVTDDRSWNDFVEDGGAIKMRLLTDSEFQLMADGTPEKAQIWHGNPVITTGGHSAYFLLELDASPIPEDFIAGRILIGEKSHRTCIIVSKITSTKYLCKNLGKLEDKPHLHYERKFFQKGEKITDGLNSKQCGLDYPKCTIDSRGRMVSNIGCEDCSGAFWQWLDEQCYRMDGQDVKSCRTWGWHDLINQKGSIFGQGTYGDSKMFAGSNWFYGKYAGSQTRSVDGFRWDKAKSVSCRFCVESRKTI